MDVDAAIRKLNCPSKLFTLVIVRDKDNILLGFKKRGFGLHKWNGFGGKVEPGESVADAAQRELMEECGLKAKSMVKHGILWFLNEAWSEKLNEVHLFTATEFEGDVRESEEMRPKWFQKTEIPYDQMWCSSRYWLPVALENKVFNAFFHYESSDKLLKHIISECPERSM